MISHFRGELRCILLSIYVHIPWLRGRNFGFSLDRWSQKCWRGLRKEWGKQNIFQFLNLKKMLLCKYLARRYYFQLIITLVLLKQLVWKSSRVWSRQYSSPPFLQRLATNFSWISLCVEISLKLIIPSTVLKWVSRIQSLRPNFSVFEVIENLKKNNIIILILRLTFLSYVWPLNVLGIFFIYLPLYK